METEFTNPNGKDSQAVTVPSSRRPNNFWLIIIAALFIIVPFLTWYLTWFGRALSDEDVATYLADEKNPRHLQHALSQVAERIGAVYAMALGRSSLALDTAAHAG